MKVSRGAKILRRELRREDAPPFVVRAIEPLPDEVAGWLCSVLIQGRFKGESSPTEGGPSEAEEADPPP